MDFLFHLLITLGLTLPNVLGYNLIFGKGKIFHFGPMGVSLLSAYTTVLILSSTGSYITAFIAGLFVALLISSFFVWLSLRLEPDGLGIMSIAVHLAIIAIVLNWTSLTRGALGIPRIPRIAILESLPVFALITTFIATLSFFLILLLDRSSFGRKLTALAENEWYAKSLGVSRTRIHFSAFLISGTMASIVNFLWPQYLRLLHPNDFLFPSFIFFIMIVVSGKPGSVSGVTLATILLVLLKEAIRFVPLAPSILGPVRLILFGLILFVAVWIRRDSLFPKQRTI